MAITTFLILNKDMPRLDPGPTWFRTKITTGTALAQNDVCNICQIPRNTVFKSLVLSVSGTIGASATLQLKRQTTALTAATTAGAATFLNQNAVDVPNTTDGTDYLNMVVAGAAAGTSATVYIEGLLVEALS